MARFHIFLVKADYELLAAHALFSEMYFVRHGEYPTRKIPIPEGLAALTGLGDVDATASRRGEHYFVYPTKPIMEVSQFTRKIEGRKPEKVFTPNGSNLDVWLSFEPCVIGKQHITPGHFETIHDTGDTRTFFNRIKKCFDKLFVKTRYWSMPTYVGQGALDLQKAGYRLCANENFARKDDLKLKPAPKKEKAKVKATVIRRTIDETWQHLGKGMPRTKGKPFVPPQMPSYDDDELGFSFFRTRAEEDDYSNCSFPRTFFGRSELNSVSFRNADLSESRMCWNNFTECDFSKADLSGCDMRASNFVRCKFDGADLRRADLCMSDFEGSSFTGAKLKGELMDYDSAADWSAEKHLSKTQTAEIDWHEDPGDQPDGG